MPYTVTAQPSLEPVSLTELKEYLRITDTVQDTLLTELILAARKSVEQATRRALVTQSITAIFSDWPLDEADALELPIGNALTIASIKYRDTTNTQQTVSASDYLLVTATQPGRVYFKDTFTFPDVYERKDAIEVAITAGFGPAAANVPEPLKVAIKGLASYWFEQRLPVNVGNIVNEMPMHVASIIGNYRVIVTEQ